MNQMLIFGSGWTQNTILLFNKILFMYYSFIEYGSLTIIRGLI